MNESILNTIKDLLMIKGTDAFDQIIIVHINSVLMQLNQLGVGPKDVFSIFDSGDTWEDFLGNLVVDFQAVKTYIYLKVKMLFDPPTSSFVLDAMNNECAQYEWRLNIQAEGRKSDGDNDE